MANSRSGESVIQRVVRVLLAFTRETPALSMRQLAREVDLPLSTVHRMVSELEVEGLLEWDSDGLLRHGHRLWELASRGSRAADLREAALPSMEDLLSIVGKYAQLGVLDGSDVLYIEQLVADESFGNVAHIAGRLPAHSCSAGLVLMAYSSEQMQETFLSRRLRKVTEATVVDPVELRHTLEETRRVGYVSMEGILLADSSGISVPIFDGRGDAVATLTLVVERGSEHLPVTVPLLKATSGAITRRLGFDSVNARTAPEGTR